LWVAPFTKFPVGFLFLVAMPLALIVMPHAARVLVFSPASRLKLFVAYTPAMLLLVFVLAVAIMRARVGQPPGFGLTDLFNRTHSASRVETIAANGPRLLEELTAQLTWPVVLLATPGIAAALWKGSPYQRWLTLMGFVPIAGIVFVASQWFGRYVLTALPPLTVSAVCGWQWLLAHGGRLKTALATTALAICVSLMGYQSALLILDPLHARWSPIDQYGYITGPASGYGFAEAATYVQHADPPPLIYAFDVATAMQLRSGLPPEWAGRVEQLYVIDGRSLSLEERKARLLTLTPAWLVTPEALDPKDSYVASHLRPVAAFERPGGQTAVMLYEVNP
ncbi:MAG: hypothetical protein ACRDH2_05225, partial [Anaerolineales bacterium]